MPEDAIANAIFCWSYFQKKDPNPDSRFPSQHAIMPTFDAPAPASSVPEGMGISSGKVTGVSKVRFQILVSHSEKHWERADFAHSKNFKLSPCQDSFTILSSGII
ncbi:hypothetical protein TNCV_2116031 [Trichonephila clavipes]|nr:hypothetical protein TNCV_2116031 [Trichonephila clavipes]